MKCETIWKDFYIWIFYNLKIFKFELKKVKSKNVNNIVQGTKYMLWKNGIQHRGSAKVTNNILAYLMLNLFLFFFFKNKSYYLHSLVFLVSMAVKTIVLSIPPTIFINKYILMYILFTYLYMYVCNSKNNKTFFSLKKSSCQNTAVFHKTSIGSKNYWQENKNR